jgi:hypothetical protein
MLLKRMEEIDDEYFLKNFRCVEPSLKQKPEKIRTLISGGSLIDFEKKNHIPNTNPSSLFIDF